MAAAAAESENEMCALCLGTMLDRDPRMLPCAHSFCLVCLQNFPLVKACFVCRREFQPPLVSVGSLPRNFWLTQIAELKKRHQSEVARLTAEIAAARRTPSGLEEVHIQHHRTLVDVAVAAGVQPCCRDRWCSTTDHSAAIAAIAALNVRANQAETTTAVPATEMVKRPRRREQEGEARSHSASAAAPAAAAAAATATAASARGSSVTSGGSGGDEPKPFVKFQQLFADRNGSAQIDVDDDDDDFGDFVLAPSALALSRSSSSSRGPGSIHSDDVLLHADPDHADRALYRGFFDSLGERRHDDRMAAARTLFQQIDVHGTGAIDQNRFVRALVLGRGVPQADCEAMFAVFSSEGALRVDQFCEAIVMNLA